MRARFNLGQSTRRVQRRFAKQSVRRFSGKIVKTRQRVAAALQELDNECLLELRKGIAVNRIV
jgi:hypothetical protein